MPHNAIKVFLLDEQLTISHSLTAMLKDAAQIVLVGVAQSLSEGREGLKALEVDIIILNLTQINDSKLFVVRQIRREFETVQLLLLSKDKSLKSIYQSVIAGIHGFLPYEAMAQELQNAITTLAKGALYMSHLVPNTFLMQYVQFTEDRFKNKELQALTERELQILMHIAQGYNNGEIAKMLYISLRTAETHKNNIMRKLGLHSTVDLMRFAFKHQLVDFIS